MHRLLKSAGAGEATPAASQEAGIAEVGRQCSMTERRAESAAFEVLGRLKARFMADRVGEVFSGVISGVQSFGIFVTLDDYPIDGLAHVSQLGQNFQDFFVYDRVRMELEGRRNGRRFRLGDAVTVIVGEVDAGLGRIDFRLAEAAKPARRARRRH